MENDILRSVFPLDRDVNTEVDRLTMGYDDVSLAKIATSTFRAMSDNEVDALHKFTTNGLVDPFSHVPYITHLVDGYHERDPERQFTGAQEDVLHEIESSRTYLQSLVDHDFIPTLMPQDSSMPEGAQIKHAWNVRQPGVTYEREAARSLLPDMENARNYVENPHDPELKAAYLQGGMRVLMQPIVYVIAITSSSSE